MKMAFEDSVHKRFKQQHKKLHLILVLALVVSAISGSAHSASQSKGQSTRPPADPTAARARIFIPNETTMLRSKRQRSSQSHSNEHGGGGGSDDELLRMNPSLMTERQQLAFLLRKTAQDASASDSAQSSDSSEDELIQSFAKGVRRIQRACVDVKRGRRWRLLFY